MSNSNRLTKEQTREILNDLYPVLTKVNKGALSVSAEEEGYCGQRTKITINYTRYQTMRQRQVDDDK